MKQKSISQRDELWFVGVSIVTSCDLLGQYRKFSCFRTKTRTSIIYNLIFIIYNPTPIISVVYRFFTPPLAGIGKLPALAGQYFSIGITVGILTVRFGGNTFEDFAGTLFLKIWREFLLSLKRRAKCTKGGRSPPPSFGKGGSRQF